MSLRFALGSTHYIKVVGLHDVRTKLPVEGAEVTGKLYDSDGNLIDSLTFDAVAGSPGDYATRSSALKDATGPVDYQCVLVVVADLGYFQRTRSYDVVIASDVDIPVPVVP